MRVAQLPVPLESEEGKTLVAYLRINGYNFHHSPNETGRTPEMRRRAVRMKQQGTSKGFPDYVVVLKRGGIAIVELKRVRGSATSQEQKDWIVAFQAAGIPARICKGADAAISFIKEVEQQS